MDWRLSPFFTVMLSFLEFLFFLTTLKLRSQGCYWPGWRAGHSPAGVSHLKPIGKVVPLAALLTVVLVFRFLVAQGKKVVMLSNPPS